MGLDHLIQADRGGVVSSPSDARLRAMWRQMCRAMDVEFDPEFDWYGDLVASVERLSDADKRRLVSIALTPLPVLDLASPDPCSGCGRCCLHVTSPPFYGLGDPSWVALMRDRPDLVAEINADYDRRYSPGGPGGAEAPCLWFDAGTGRCRNYGHRPDICIDFEVGEEDCLRMRADDRVASIAEEG